MSLPSIITDSAVQFPQPTFAGRNLVKVVPLDVRINATIYPGGEGLKPAFLPPTLPQGQTVALLSPEPEEYYRLFVETCQTSHEVLAIFSSSSLLPVYAKAQQAATTLDGRLPISLIDSQTIGVGLGLLVETAAVALAGGVSLAETDRLVRSMIPHIYTVIASPGLSYLHQAGFLDFAQAWVGESLGMLPIFTLEEGRLTPMEKVRSHRQITEFFQEFMDEYERLSHIALVQGGSGSAQETRLLREHAQDCFPSAHFSEHNLNQTLSVLFGPKTSSMVLIESTRSHARL